MIENLTKAQKDLATKHDKETRSVSCDILTFFLVVAKWNYGLIVPIYTFIPVTKHGKLQENHI